ncbi:AAA family ATPase [uncultured Rothia sp.]|uniref:AAA family ATPase n=1 Tax=uncultured Rothia sp. TaxID=316088 RepID=UPI0025F04C30|nr:AAA family ATPase [uncultured Rothia sp.]
MVDATKVSSIKIDTGYAGVKEYPFFARADKNNAILNKDAQFAIVFGKNGSGKSTVAHALSTGRGRIDFLDREGKSLKGDCSNVHVFNESYVIENFRRYAKEHIKPVILLGNYEQKKERISELASKISVAEEKVENILNRCLNRALGGNSLIASLSFGGSTVREYVSAYIKNVLYAGDYENADLEYINYAKYFESEMLDIVESGVICSQGEYATAVSYFFDYAHNKILRELTGGGYILGLSVSDVEEILDEEFDEIDKLVELIRDFGMVENNLYLKDRLSEAAYWLILLIYKRDVSLFQKINGNIIAESELQVLGICEQDLAQLRNNLQREQEELDKERNEYSSRRVTGYINTLLCMVFGGRKMWLESDADFGYTVHNKHGIIPPSRLSIGEQNILSLCYFFAEMSKGKELESSIQDNKIIVLDDPISSLDFYNKAGINWMIDYIVKIMCFDGALSKMIIMTHNLSVAKELEKTIKGRINGRDVRAGDKLKCCDIEDLERGIIKGRNFGDDDNYRDILLEMYKVANYRGELGGVDLPHFNDVRRVWEAFLKFELGEDQISNRNAVDRVSCFHDKKSPEGIFLESFIIYNYINQGSHSLDSVADYDFDFAPPLSVGESREYIKKIILFMHMVSPHHIPCRLSRKMEDIYGYRHSLDELYNEEVLKQP